MYISEKPQLTPVYRPGLGNPPGPGDVRVGAVHGLLDEAVLRARDLHPAGEHRLVRHGGGQHRGHAHVVHHAPPHGGGAGVGRGALDGAGAGPVVLRLRVAGEGESGLGEHLLDGADHGHLVSLGGAVREERAGPRLWRMEMSYNTIPHLNIFDPSQISSQCSKDF